MSKNRTPTHNSRAPQPPTTRPHATARTPTPPPAYRPQPAPRCLQLKPTHAAASTPLERVNGACAAAPRHAHGPNRAPTVQRKTADKNRPVRPAAPTPGRVIQRSAMSSSEAAAIAASGGSASATSGTPTPTPPPVASGSSAAASSAAAAVAVVAAAAAAPRIKVGGPGAGAMFLASTRWEREAFAAARAALQALQAAGTEFASVQAIVDHVNTVPAVVAANAVAAQESVVVASLTGNVPVRVRDIRGGTWRTIPGRNNGDHELFVNLGGDNYALHVHPPPHAGRDGVPGEVMRAGRATGTQTPQAICNEILRIHGRPATW